MDPNRVDTDRGRRPEATIARRFDFDQGLPDPTLYPTQMLAASYAEVLGADGAAACDYYADDRVGDMAYGHHGLRNAIASWLSSREACRVSEDDVLLANGSTNGIAMTINALLGPGDALIVEELSYPYAAAYGRAAGASVLTVPVGPRGMEVEQLEATLQRARSQGLRPRMIYTVATFHSPTGTVLAIDRREMLIETARRFDAVVLDDNCYYHLWYVEPPPPSLLALDDADTVIQSGSFSKYLAPGLRMAWLAGHRDRIATIAEARQDFAVSQVTARVVEQFVRDGLDDHLDLLRTAYRTKRDIAAQALAQHCGEHATFAVPQGGLYFWLAIEPRVDFAEAMARATELGVGFRPGVRFQHGCDGSNYLRLSVAQSPPDDIEPGIARLGTALREAAR